MTDFYAPVFRHILFPLYETGLRKRKTLQYLKEYQQHLNWSAEQLKAYQWEKLYCLLKHSFDNVPYYKNKWQSIGLTSVQEIRNLEDFSKLPVLTKDDVAEYYDSLVSSQINEKHIYKATGGSTGQPFRFEYNISSDEKRQAVMWRGYSWLGAGLGVKTFHLWGADIGHVGKLRTIKNSLYHRYYNRKIVSSFAMCNDNISSYIVDINHYKPEAIVAYVNPLYLLAKYILDTGIKVHSPKSIITGAEALHDFQRELIEQAFSCKVYNTYGCREFMSIALECEKQMGLHINADHLLVETINQDGRSVIGESGDLIITDLSNYGMPLIRYVNGDRAKLSSNVCSCGNPLPIMEKIEGRKLDVIKTPLGGVIPGEFFPHLLKEFAGIEKFQVKQKVLEEIDVLLVANDKLQDSDLSKIETEFERYGKGSVKINFIKVDDIALTSSGKYRVTICELDDE